MEWTVDGVRKRIQETEAVIRKTKDYEDMSGREWYLMYEFIEHIGKSGSEFADVANEVLKITDLDFPRW